MVSSYRHQGKGLTSTSGLTKGRIGIASTGEKDDPHAELRAPKNGFRARDDYEHQSPPEIH